MSSLTQDQLFTAIERAAEKRLPRFPFLRIDEDPVDVAKSYIVQLLVEKTGCEPDVAYGSIQKPADLGDLVAVIPRLRLVGVHPRKLAEQLALEVRSCHLEALTPVNSDMR